MANPVATIQYNLVISDALSQVGPSVRISSYLSNIAVKPGPSRARLQIGSTQPVQIGSPNSSGYNVIQLVSYESVRTITLSGLTCLNAALAATALAPISLFPGAVLSLPIAQFGTVANGPISITCTGATDASPAAMDIILM